LKTSSSSHSYINPNNFTLFIVLKILVYATSLICLINIAYQFIKEKGYPNREKYTCYECGFESKIRSRIPFRLRFFMLTIVYLLFDIEVLVAFRYLYNEYFSTPNFPFFLFILFCLVTLYLEWMEGSLDW